MEKVIVTGATSMIGVALIEECIKNNVKVLAVVRKAGCRLSRLPHSSLIEVIECDLENLADIPESGDNYDCLYHFAWAYTSRDVRDNPELQLKNIRYTLEAVRLAKRIGCKRFIGAGSQAEYGACDEMITTKTKVQPFLSYGICKYTAGKLAEKLCNELGMICVWGRVFSVYGENDNEGTMIRYAFEKYYAKEVAVFSAGTQMWNYLYASDAGRMFYLMGEKCVCSKVYNVAYHKNRLLKDYIQDLKLVLGDEFCYKLGQDSAVKVQLNPDTSETNEDLGFFPQVSFREGIKRMKENSFAVTHNTVE